MFEYGNADLESIIKAMYDYYEVLCIAEDVTPVLRDVFGNILRASYYYYLSNIKGFNEFNNIVKVSLNKIGDILLFWVEISGSNADNIEMFLVRNPEV